MGEINLSELIKDFEEDGYRVKNAYLATDNVEDAYEYYIDKCQTDGWTPAFAEERFALAFMVLEAFVDDHVNIDIDGIWTLHGQLQPEAA